MKLSRRHLLKGLTASAAAHSFGTFTSFATPWKGTNKELVVFQFGHAQDDHFQTGIKQATGHAAELTLVKVQGDLLSNLPLLREQLQLNHGKHAVVLMDHSQHAVFHELVREARVKLLQTAQYSTTLRPVHHANLRLLSSNDADLAQTWADLMTNSGWSFHLEANAYGEASDTRIWNSAQRFSTELNQSFGSGLRAPAIPLAGLLGFALAQQVHASPALPAVSLHELSSSTPVASNAPDSAVTLLLEL